MAEKTIDYELKKVDEGRADLVVARLTELSRARVRGLFDHGGVRLNGASLDDPGARVGVGDQLNLVFDPARRYKEKPAARATRGFTVVFVDQHIVVVDKQAGILTVPTTAGEGKTLVDLLSTHLNQGQPRRTKVSVVHRLDRDTSGLLVFGRTPQMAQRVIDQFVARKPQREYAAISAGRLEKDKGVIRSHLATDKALNQRSVSKHGELAVTHYEVKERYRDATLVVVRLETGRRNQIRVHLAELGHPILGDTRYRPDMATHAAWPYKRLALHARVLGFNHPATGETLSFESELPGEFAAFANKTKR